MRRAASQENQTLFRELHTNTSSNTRTEDWDICVAIEYKNYAALDGLAAKGEAARDKILGGKAPAQELSEKRAEIREIISSELLQEVFLK